MAYTKKQVNTEHPSKTIVKMVQSAKETGVWPKVMLLYGKEDFLVSWSKKYLKTQLINPACEVLDCITFSENAQNAYEIIAACETMPLMSERKLIIVDDSDILSAQSPKDMDTAQVAALVDYIPNIPETTMILFTSAKPNKTKAIYKAINKHGIAYDFCALDDATLSGWMAKRLKAQGRSARPDDLLTYAKNCGYGDPERNYTLNNLENDLKKVFASTEKSVLSLDDFMENSAAQAEINAFKLLDCAFTGNKGEAITILHNTIDIQTSSKEMGAIMSFLGLLCSQLEIMVEGKERENDGYYISEIASQMNVNEYRLKKAMAACRNKSASALRQNLFNAFQIEKDLKSGNMDGRLALELFIAKL
ncbi:MAG: DNA polymerase III subunit delta [Clostridia bacterium]|nr:DNA polymerase III subunit delta [Clostridia bacterium]